MSERPVEVNFFLTTEEIVQGYRLCEVTDFVATSLTVIELPKYHFRTKRWFPIMINNNVLIEQKEISAIR